jgi:hypothetical protein
VRRNAANGIEARVWPGNSDRIQIQMGVERFTATTDEAIELARALVAAVDDLKGCRT